MDNRDKEILMKSVIQDDYTYFLNIFNQYGLLLDDSFFDYDLLKAALGKKDKTIAYFLVRTGARVRNPNKAELEETPLHLAMTSYFDVSHLLMILREGASVYDKNLKGETPLYAAFKGEEYEALDVVLDYISNDNFLSLNSNNQDDVLHFNIACIRNHISSVKVYLEAGIDVNRYFNAEFAEVSGLNPLHYAMNNGYSELFKMLLNHGGDLSIKNQQGLTPLHIFYYKYYNYNYNNFDYQSFILFSHKDEMIQTFNYGNNTKFINAVDINGLSHLHIYCLTNYPDFVKVLIDNGEDVNRPISLNCFVHPGFTPLQFAVENNCAEVVELLLKNGADCNKENERGITLLYLACEKYITDADDAVQARAKIIELLLKSGADCRSKSNKTGITPLRLMYKSCGEPKKFKIMKMLLDYKACPTEVDKKGNTFIHLAFQKACYYINSEARNVFDIMMSKIPVGVNLTNDEGISLFHIACTRNNINQVNQFLNSGVVIDSCVVSGKYQGYTALYFAVLFNQKSVIEVLLQRNAQVNIKTREFMTMPLHVACEYRWIKYYKLATSTDNPINSDWMANRTNQLEIVKLLLIHGADVDAKDSSGSTPLHRACMINENDYAILNWPVSFKAMLINEISTRAREITKILLSYKANVHARLNNQSTVLHIICENEFLKKPHELTEFFITYGVNINAVNDSGSTPLHFAVGYERKEVVQSLLKHKAKVNIKNKEFKTPLQIASADQRYEPIGFSRVDLYYLYNSNDMSNILLINCNDINERNENGRTLLHDAVKRKNILLIQKLLYFGADINIEDSFGNSTICPCSRYFHQFSLKIFEIIIVHIQKLSALKLYVSEKVQKVCNEINHHYKTSERNDKKDLDNVFDECFEELNRMKLKMIDNYTSLYNILLKSPHELSKHVRNRILIEILEDLDVDIEFPFYSYLLKVQFKKGLVRHDILESAKTSLIDVIGLNLPDSCYDSILTFLTNEEVINLKVAANVKES